MTTHGGHRSGAGRKPSPFISKRIVLHLKNELELEYILDRTTPRERTEAMIEYLENQPQGVQTIWSDDDTNE